MFRSVRRRLILNSLLIALVAILAVGVVTLMLVGRYFVAQEQTYLQQRADTVMPLFVELFSASQPDDLEGIITLTSFFTDVRIELLDESMEVVIDSGPRETGRPFLPPDVRINSGRFGMRLQDDGSIDLVRNNSMLDVASPFATQLSLTFSEETPITSISSTTLAIPLQSGESIIGFLRLSEGPAAGEGVIRSIQNALISGSVIAFIVAVMVGSISGRQIERPLRNLKNAANAMANDDLSARAPQSKLKEFNQLATQFNRMASQIEGDIDRLESERTVLKRMTADASHELRTPLTALKTFNTLLKDEVESPMATQLVAESGLQIEQLYHMTTGLLDLSRLEARLSGTEFIVSDLRSTVTATVESLRAFADNRNQQVTLSLPTSALEMAHDSDALQQAIGNIVLNGLKYSEEGSGVNVVVSAEPDKSATITITDSGMGISAEALPNIFNRFYRDPIQKSEGTGLGLAITKEIISIHNGSISVESELGTGTTFIITLPLNTTLPALLANSISNGHHPL